MIRHSRSTVVRLVIALILAWPAIGVAQDLKTVQLAPPTMEGGMPLMQALKARATSRSFSGEPLPDRILSNLAWAAFGINRPDSGRRTAPSAQNAQEIDVYVVMETGTYVYDAKAHALTPVVAGDLRALTGKQSFAKDAPVTLVFVADYARMGRASQEDRDLYSAADTGYISQNVYLFCASEGLATGVRASIDRPALAKAMKLRPEQKIILAQSVGHPKK